MPSTTLSEACIAECSAERGSSPVIELAEVSVRFRLPSERIASFKEYILRRITRRIEYRDLWALRSLDLTVRRGEIVGIIGRNGAGKSTLLKVMSRVLRPTSGRVIVRGRLAPLLELGAGFQPDLTGRENVLLNATILGYPRASVRRRLEEVVEFAELPSFIDAPIRTYSSGMQARLGFAVATLFRPEILLVDETLAVGDIGFQQKCLARIEEFKRDGTAVVLVSHSLDTIAQHCSKAIWLEDGCIAASGRTSDVLPEYESAVLPAK